MTSPMRFLIAQSESADTLGAVECDAIGDLFKPSATQAYAGLVDAVRSAPAAAGADGAALRR